MNDETDKYLSIIEKNSKRIFFYKNNINETVDALHSLVQIGRQTLLIELVPFLTSGNNELRNAVCDTIIKLFRAIGNKTDYYESLKHCAIGKSDLDFFEKVFTKKQYSYLLAIASFNYNGYVREKAVRKLSLSNDGDVIRFLIYRLADWVDEVRWEAIRALKKYKDIAFLDALIKNVDAFEWTKEVLRANLEDIRNEFMDFITVENKPHLLLHFASYSDKARLILANSIMSSSAVTAGDLKLLLSDKNFLIRDIAIRHSELLSEEDIEKLLKDKSGKIRLQALRLQKSKPGFTDLIFTYLADESANVRYFARFTIGLNAADFAQVYYEKLLKNEQVIGCLLGLAETNGRQFSVTVERFLNNQNTKIKRAAFLALSKLDERSAYNFALQQLDCEPTAIPKTVKDFLAVRATTEVLDTARRIYATGKADGRLAMLKFFNKVGGWPVLADIMKGTIDDDKDNRRASAEYLIGWKKKAVSLFMKQKEEDILRAREMFTTAYKTHETEKYFDINPLDRFDFYLK